MIVFDIIVGALLIWALVSGLRNGIAVQLAGIAGLFAGVWLASRLGRALGEWLGFGPEAAGTAGFIIVLILVLIGMGFLGKLVHKIFCAAGLGTLDRLFGGILSLVKVGLILGLLLYGFDALNRRAGWVDKSQLGGSVAYQPMIAVAEFSFPFIEMAKNKLLSDPAKAQETREREEWVENQPEQQL